MNRVSVLIANFLNRTTCIVTNFPYPEDDDTGSVGRSLPGMDMKLVDDEGKDITDYDTRGELCVRGPTVIGGYLDKVSVQSVKPHPGSKAS